MQSKYDIFISYKRKSLPTANNLYYRLTTRGYSTFFDLEEMRRDNFNVQLLNYIENAKDVFVILEEGSLDSCQKDDWEKDWFCHEIAFALEKKKNIIPILLNGYTMPSSDLLPDKLKELSLKHSPDFSFSFFDAYLDKLIEKKFITSEAHVQNKATSVFKFYSNENCQVFKEGKLVCSLQGMSDEPYYLPVPRKGDFRFKGVNDITSESKLIKEHIEAEEERDIEFLWEIGKHLLCDTENMNPSEQVTICEKPVIKDAITGIGKKEPYEKQKQELLAEIVGRLLIYKNHEFDKKLHVVYDKNWKYGYADRDGYVVIPCRWDAACAFCEGLAAVYDEKTGCGFIDKSGKVNISCKWKDVGNFCEGMAYVKNDNGKYGYLDKNGNLVVSFNWMEARDFSEGRAAVKDIKDYWGFIDKSGKLVSPCVWQSVGDFCEGVAVVEDSNGKHGFIDKCGNVVIACMWDAANDFKEGLAAVQNFDKKCGFINKDGKITIPCIWQEVGDFSEGRSVVYDKNGKAGYIDYKGKVVIPIEWDEAYMFCNNVAYARKKDKLYEINKNGMIIVEIHEDEFDNKEGLSRIEENGKYGFCNSGGDIVIPCIWNFARIFYNDMSLVWNSKGKCGYIDSTGKNIIPCLWEDAFDFSEEYAAVQGDNKKWGFINKTGKTVIPCKWELGGYFHEELASVMDNNDKWGFIDKQGIIVLPFVWKSAGDFSEGLAPVEDFDGHWSCIDKSGKVVFSCSWAKHINSYYEGLAAVQDKQERWGFIDKCGKLVIPCIWDSVEDFSNGLSRVINDNGKYGFIDRNGTIVIHCRWKLAYQSDGCIHVIDDTDIECDYNFDGTYTEEG